MKNIVWLASYPKSGNTWLRILMDSILNKNGETVDINKISLANLGFLSRQRLDEFLEFDSSSLSVEETYYYKRKFFQEFDLNLKKEAFLKTHDANIQLFDGAPLIPEDITKLVIYLVRNPLDIVASLANHHGITNEEAITLILNDTYTLFRSKKGITTSVDQFIGSWQNNVLSWLNSDLPLIVLRYEDMLIKPTEMLIQIFRLLEIDVDRHVIQRAVNNNSFEVLRRMEEDIGFKERNGSTERFFRQAKSGAWKKELTSQQVNKVINDFEPTLKRLGYFPAIKAS